MYRIYLIAFLALSLNLHSQITISGTVGNKSSLKPIIGCSVYNVNTQRGTVTNEDGEYAISATKGDIIQFSFIGMQIVEKYILDNTDIDIELEYASRKIKEVKIHSDNLAKASILYNKDYEKYKRNQFIEPKRKSAKEKIAEASPKYSSNGFSMSPITMMYYAFNKREQRKLGALQDIQKMDMSNQKYTLEFISLVTKVNEEVELKDIKAYCYFSHEQVLNSSFYELGLLLKECYNRYSEDKILHPNRYSDSTQTNW